jgi:hypothetical protein
LVLNASATVTAHTNTSILDTGANISVVTADTVATLNLPSVPLHVPVTLQLANGSVVEISNMVSLGPILGHAAVVPTATTNLISPTHLLSNGYELHFSQHGAGLFRNGTLVLKGIMDPHTKLFTIDSGTPRSLANNNKWASTDKRSHNELF